MNVIDRPQPVGTSKRGRPRYDPDEVAAYRKAKGVTQVEVAQRLRCSQGLIASYERARERRFDLVDSAVLPMLDAVDHVAVRKARMVAEGLAELQTIRAARTLRP